MRKIRGLLVSGVAVISLVALTAPAAEAATFVPNRIQEVWTTLSGNYGSAVDGYVSCPAGMKVISAGAGNASLSELTTTDDGNGAFASGAIGNGFSGPAYMPLQADCVPAADLRGVVVSAGTLADHRRPGVNVTYDLIVNCPTGYYAFGGGGYFTNSSGVALLARGLQADSPTENGTGWRFAAIEATGLTLHAKTQCAPNPAPPSGVIVSTSFPIPVPSPGNQPVAGYANCPAGHVPLSGGAYYTYSAGGEIEILHSQAVRNPSPYPSGWYAAAQGYGLPTGPAVLHIVVRCL